MDVPALPRAAGLGLAITPHIFELRACEIAVEVVIGEGIRFVVRLTAATRASGTAAGLVDARAAAWSRHREDTPLSIRIVRLGHPRAADEGLRIGTVRRPPRGVRKEDYARKDIYDLWFPNLSPSEALLKEGMHAEDERAWKIFRRKFMAEMKASGARRDLDLLAALSHQTNFSVGCYCENEDRCHRSILKELLSARGADLG